ncbi:carboxypeptidase-like regulatory domain-containing protein [Terriglobus aquaticus]|uniref:carboxypeptidase-like regulatory domain-containing protein n=1 Tax=Terriglobus aquaticus TaxID=940139 RepID=UPI0021DF7E5C|nr:TonB-dependent receptor [Terriglobus aquaticus]
MSCLWPRSCAAGIVAVAAAAVLFAPAGARSQALTTGAVGGVLRDAAGVALPGVRLTMRLGRLPERTVETDALGEFRIDDLQPGEYEIRCERDGFASLRVPLVRVAAGQAVRLALTMVVGSAQSLTVRASEAERPSLVDSPLNASLLPQELIALPIDGRRFQDFALLTPLTNLGDDSGAFAVNPSGGSSMSGDRGEDATGTILDTDTGDSSAETVQTTTRSSDPSQASFTLDGFTANRSYDGAPRGGAAIPFNVPLEAVREFQVRSIGEGSPLGRDAAGSVNAVTRRAGEDLHGSAFFLLRHSAADATDPFAIATHYNGGAPFSEIVKPRDQREQFGGSIGSRLPHTANRVYAFGAAEGQLRSFPGISSPDNPAFYTLTAVQTALLANRGVTAAETARGLGFLDSLTGEVPRRSSTLALTPRLDIVTSPKSSLLLTYTGARHDAPSGARGGAVVAQSRDNFSTLHIAADTLRATESVGLGARWVVETGMAISRDATTVTEAPTLAAEPQTGPAGSVPQVSIDLGNATSGGAFRFGLPVAAEKRRLPNEDRAEAEVSVTFSGRAHSVTLQAAGSLIDTAVDTGAATTGAYQYGSRSTGGRAGGLVDFLTDFTYSATSYPNGGCPSIYATTHLFCFQSFTQGFGAGTSVRFHTGEGSAGVHDVWRLTPRLHVTLGARYEYFRMPLPQHANVALDTVFGNLGQTGFLPGDPGNLAPRLGIAYGLHDRTVVRVGYGLHFGRATGRLLQQVLTNTAQAASVYNLRVTPTTEIEPACSSAGTNFGYPATYTCGSTGLPAKTSAATVLSRRFQLPTVEDGEVTVERQISHGIVVSVSYAAALSHELPNSTDVNLAPSLSAGKFAIQRTDAVTTPGLQNGATFVVPVYTSRISPDFGPVTLVRSNGNAAYQAGVVQVSRVAARGLTVRGAYTFSKSLDNLRVTGSAVDTDAQFDPVDPSYDRALSNLDRRHKVTATAVWAPELEHGSRFERRLANGFTVAPILFVTSGRPYSFLVEGGTTLAGGRASLNGSGGATYLPSVGRNTLRLPTEATLDLRLARAIPLHEGATLRLTAEGFNLFNHRNVTSVTQRAFIVGTTVNGVTPLVFQDAAAIAAEGLTTRPFGTETGSGTDLTRARRLQGGLRFEW